MADNTANAKIKLASQRKAVAEHIEKWRKYSEPYDKTFALKTIANAQGHIKKIKDDHPSLRQDNQPEDTWTP